MTQPASFRFDPWALLVGVVVLALSGIAFEYRDAIAEACVSAMDRGLLHAFAFGRRHGMRQRSRGAVFVTVALALVGCEDGSSGALASEALCSDPAAYEGREIWVEGALDTSEPVLWGQSAALCSEAQPCCNTADYVYALACGGRDAVPIVVVPDVTLSDSERAQLGGLSCRGLASGGIAAECRPSCDTTLAASVRALRGTLGPVVSGIEGQVRVLSVISVERSAVPDAGPLPDAAE